MAEQKIEREILIEAPVQVVWRVLTEAEHIQSWFSDEATFEPRPGARGELVFRKHGHRPQVEVQTVEEPHRFAFRWDHPAGSAADETNSLYVEFNLVEEGQHTRLHLLERGFEHGERAPQQSEHERGWGECLERLVDYAQQHHHQQEAPR
jgi:uncharacterized protein YndB with AHSA1/START domain